MKIKRLFIIFICGLILAFILGGIFLGIFNLPGAQGFGGDKSAVLFCVFFGMPFGSLLGIFLIDKFYYHLKGYNLLGISIGFILSFLWGIESLVVIEEIGRPGIILAALISTCFSFVGYNIPLIRKEVTPFFLKKRMDFLKEQWRRLNI